MALELPPFCLLQATVQELQDLVSNSSSTWLHRHICHTLVLVYSSGHHMLRSQLSEAGTLLSSQQLHSVVTPAFVVLSDVVEEGREFILACRGSEVAHTTHDEAKLSWPWILTALTMGLAVDAQNNHLHDFLLAMTTACAAIRCAVVEKANPRGKEVAMIVSSWRKEEEGLLVQPEKFRLSTLQNHSPPLFDAMVLHLQQKWNMDALRREVKVRSYKCTDDKLKNVASLLDRKIDCALSTSSQKSDAQTELFLSFSDVDYTDHCVLYESDAWVDSKVWWWGQVFLLRQYKNCVGKPGVQEYALLDHPNVVRIFCFLQNDNDKYSALMEHMEVTLEQAICDADSRLTLTRKVWIMLQIAKGMEYFHSRNLIHEDLKPANVFLKDKSGSGNTVKVGTCYMAHVTEGVYTAPEVLNQNAVKHNLTYQVDVYSFAMLCYYILAGKEPFSGAPRDKLLWDKIVLCNERPDLVSVTDNNDCPLYLKYCLEAWWDANPSERPTFTEICRTLRHLYSCLSRKALKNIPFLRWPKPLCASQLPKAHMLYEEQTQGRLLHAWNKEGCSIAHNTTLVNIPNEVWLLKALLERPALNNELLDDGSKFHLKSLDRAAYICAENGGGEQVTVHRKEAKVWETFKIWRQGTPGVYFLQALEHHQFLIVDSNDGCRIKATALIPRLKETFTITRQYKSDRVHLRAYNGKYVQVNGEKWLYANYASSTEPAWDEKNTTFFLTRQ